MRTGQRASSRTSSYRVAAVKAGFVGLALVASLARWLPGATQARPQIEKLSLGGSAGSKGGSSPQGCDAVLEVAADEFESLRAGWASTAGSDGLRGDYLIPKFGKEAAKVEERTLEAFDNALESEGTCQRQRAALLSTMRKAIWQEFLAQRQLTERATSEALNNKLLRMMRRRGTTLRTREKLGALQQAVASYRQRVEAQLPAWAAAEGDPEAQAAERRLGLQQFRVEESQAGRALQARWASQASKRLLGQRAHGFSISVDPALRVMVRPEGLGNLQVFSTGPVGPPDQPATVNIGVMNDGSMADVYREHPVPPLVAVQPAAKVNLNLR